MTGADTFAWSWHSILQEQRLTQVFFEDDASEHRRRKSDVFRD
jgi:DICT domain-containing protein